MPTGISTSTRRRRRHPGDVLVSPPEIRRSPSSRRRIHGTDVEVIDPGLDEVAGARTVRDLRADLDVRSLRNEPHLGPRGVEALVAREAGVGRGMRALDGRRALVTGATGFIGSQLCRALEAAGAEVHGVARPGGSRWRLPTLPSEVTLHPVDLRRFTAVRALLRAVRPDIVFHAAVRNAYRRPAPLRHLVAHNVAAVANLLDALREAAFERLVHLASFLEYGVGTEPHRESDPLSPACRRGATKGAAALLALQQARGEGQPVTVLRLFSVYGPWEAPERLVPRAIRAALTGEELPLTVPGLRRDLVFVDDVAQACLCAASEAAAVGEAINVASGAEVANEEVVAAVERVVGARVNARPGRFPPRPTDTTRVVADVEKAHRLLGWRARHSLEAGLAKTVPWVARHLAAPAGWATQDEEP